MGITTAQWLRNLMTERQMLHFIDVPTVQPASFARNFDFLDSSSEAVLAARSQLNPR